MQVDKFPQLKSCLWCCDLRIGALIVGWLCLAVPAVGACFSLSVIVIAYGVVEKEDVVYREKGLGVTGEHETRLLSLTITYGALALIWTVTSIASTILLFGIYKGKQSAILLWLRIVVVLNLLAVLWAYSDLQIVRYLPCDADFVNSEFYIRLSVYTMHFALSFYFIIVIKSYYTVKQEGRD